MKTLINTLTGLAALAVMSVGLGSCTILLAPTPSSVYIDDVYGMRPAAQVVTVQQRTTAPSTADNSQGYSDNSQGYSDTDVSSYDGNAESYTDNGSVEDIIVDDSYTARIYRFHRPSYCRSYYDVAIIDPWYSDWYWSFGYHYNSPYWSFSYGMPYHYSYWGTPYYGYSWWGYHHHYYSPCYYSDYYYNPYRYHHGYSHNYHYSDFNRSYARTYDRINHNNVPYS